MLLAFSLLGLVAPPGAALALAHNLAFLLVLAALVWGGRKAWGGYRAAFLGLIFVYATAALSNLGVAVSRLLESPIMGAATVPLAQLGEAAAVVTAPLLFWTLRPRPSPTVVGAALVVTAGFALAYWADPALSGVIAIWTLGFSLYLPFPIYAAALGLMAATLLGLAHSHNRTILWGMLLLVSTGISLPSSYEQLLGAFGLSLLLAGAPQGSPQVFPPVLQATSGRRPEPGQA